MNIYQLPKEIEKALFKYYSCFDEDTGELIVEEELLKQSEKDLFNLQNKKEELLDWYLRDRANKIAENAWLQKEIDRLSARQKSNKSRINRVEKIVDYNFWEMYNGKAIAFGNFTVNYRKTKATIIDNEELIPEKFVKREMIEKVSIPKTDIKKAIESWEEVPWARIQENKNLTIK